MSKWEKEKEREENERTIKRVWEAIVLFYDEKFIAVSPRFYAVFSLEHFANYITSYKRSDLSFPVEGRTEHVGWTALVDSQGWEDKRCFWGFIYRQKGALKEEGGDEERRKGIKLMFSVCLYMQGSVNKISPFSDKYLSEGLIANRQSAEPKFKPRWSNSRAQACSHFVILLLEY